MLRKLLIALCAFVAIWACFGIAIFLTKAMLLVAFWSIVMAVFVALLIGVYAIAKATKVI